MNGGKAEYNHYRFGWFHVDGSTLLNNTNVYPGHYVIATHNKTSGLINLYADGAIQASTNIIYDATFTGFNRISGGYLNGSGTGDLFDGLVGEVLVYNRDLTSAELLSVQTYLNSRWLDVPEPSTVALVCATAFGFAVWSRRRKA